MKPFTLTQTSVNDHSPDRANTHPAEPGHEHMSISRAHQYTTGGT
jgi:hypothetical protein